MTTGRGPGWIYAHGAMQISDKEIVVAGGKIVTFAHGEECHSENASSFVLDIERRVWRVM